MGTAKLNTKSQITKRRQPEQREVPRLVQEMKEDPFMTPAEIAQLQKVDTKTVTRWCQQGKFGEAPDVIRLPSRTGHRRIRTSAYMRACDKANENE